MKVKIASWNVNGIRAVERKNAIQPFLEEISPDILCLQETKAKEEQLPEFLTKNSDYFTAYHSAEKVGYSGVSIWVKKTLCKDKPVFESSISRFKDIEGRIMNVSLGDYLIFGNYFPNGGKSDQAYNDIDLARPKQNEKNTGFTRPERDCLDRLLDDNWVDVFRKNHPDYGQLYLVAYAGQCTPKKCGLPY